VSGGDEVLGAKEPPMTDTAAAAFDLTVDTRTDEWTRVSDGENLFWVRRGATKQLVSWDDARSYEAAYSAWCRANLAPEAIADALDVAV
jgi:hypothetical protein